ncbi:hypothetical protein A6M23_10595 [Acidithiobacillus thiooxidans]|uniref:Uncharacterized protein n=1 Tax=Acidithiobacillus thiooxidans TaxID=930 RepID=A0A1C2I7X7_ACITH|nr:hypothetical protein A6M23_10595 [Acidithiobacillus thiooxidans]OCX86444.1 hypothetical protein A6P08_05995 [Acidithiobacillus thiooxidans]
MKYEIKRMGKKLGGVLSHRMGVVQNRDLVRASPSVGDRHYFVWAALCKTSGRKGDGSGRHSPRNEG